LAVVILSAVDAQELAMASLAQQKQGTREELFPGSGLASDQNGPVGNGEFRSSLQRGDEPLITPNEHCWLLIVPSLCGEMIHLPRERGLACTVSAPSNHATSNAVPRSWTERRSDVVYADHRMAEGHSAA